MENDKGMNKITKSIISCGDCENYDELVSSKAPSLKYSFCHAFPKMIEGHKGGDLPIPNDCPLLKNPYVR